MKTSSVTAGVVWAAVTVALVVLLGGILMGIAMGGHMDGMMGRRGGAAQTPVVATGLEVAVDIRDFDYIPRDLTVDAGTKITWTNYDGAPHTATDNDDAWDTERLGKNESASIRLDDSGEYGYYCVYHPYMKATVTVR